ncbi:unnamed protein product, partial [Iphiclides podalirius]
MGVSAARPPSACRSRSGLQSLSVRREKRQLASWPAAYAAYFSPYFATGYRVLEDARTELNHGRDRFN